MQIALQLQASSLECMLVGLPRHRCSFSHSGAQGHCWSLLTIACRALFMRPPAPTATRTPRASQCSSSCISALISEGENRCSLRLLWHRAKHPVGYCQGMHPRGVAQCVGLGLHELVLAQERGKAEGPRLHPPFKSSGSKSYVFWKQTGGLSSLSKHFTSLAHALCRGLLLTPCLPPRYTCAVTFLSHAYSVQLSPTVSGVVLVWLPWCQGWEIYHVQAAASVPSSPALPNSFLLWGLGSFSCYFGMAGVPLHSPAISPDPL